MRVGIKLKMTTPSMKSLRRKWYTGQRASGQPDDGYWIETDGPIPERNLLILDPELRKQIILTAWPMVDG